MSVMADIIRGRVVDADTGEVVSFAALEWLPFEGDVDIAGGMNKHMADSLGRFQFYAPGNGFLIVSMFGYENAGKNVSVFSEGRRDTLDVDDIKLKPTETLMKMLEVNARACRFTVSGDTIVFHPEAFHLEEGARLDELIRKLPGVSVGENGLSWNGRPLRIIMNGQDLFSGSAIVGMLPVEAVENIKAYNKASEFSQRTGKDDGTEDMVLDMNIKPGFLDRLYGDAKVLYQTPNRYEGEVVANRLSDHDPLMLYVDANNRNRTTKHTMQFDWSQVGREGFGQNQYGAFGYQHNWGGRQEGQTLRSFATVSGSIGHNDHWGTRYEDTRNYFPGEASNRLVTSDHYHKHSFSPHIEGALRWQKDSRNTFSLSFNGEYGRQRDRQEKQTQQTILSFTPIPSPIREEGDSVMMQSQTLGYTTGKNVKAGVTAGWMHYMPEGKGSVELTAGWNQTDNDATSQTLQEVTYTEQTNMNYTLQQDYESHTNASSVSVAAEVKRWLTERVLLVGKYALTMSRTHSEQELMTNLMPNADESFDDHYRNTAHTAILQSTINLRPFQFIPKLQYTYLHERENYLRGTLDTLARRDAKRLEPSIQMKWKMKRGGELSLTYRMSTSEPQLLYTIAFRDATNPLFVTTGNPDLRNRHTQHVDLSYEFFNAAKQQLVQVWASFTATDREHRTFLQYDERRGSYLSCLENARGNRTLSFSADYGQGSGVLFWSNSFNFFHQRSSAPLMQTFGADVRIENRQSQTLLNNNLSICADWKRLKVGALVGVSANHLANSAADVQNTTLWNNEFGINGELRKGKLTVKTELTERMRRGYLTQGMNTDHFIWNASAAWRCLNGKGKLELEVNDILNNADNFSSTETANQQVSTWSDLMHHYAAISFTYHLDPKQKKNLSQQ